MDVAALGDGVVQLLEENAVTGVAEGVGAQNALLVLDWNDAALGTYFRTSF